MNPNSIGLQVVVALALVAAVGLAIWRWKRFRLPKLSRFVALLVIQVLALTTVAIAVNRAGGFVTTWPALVGSEKGIEPHVVVDRTAIGSPDSAGGGRSGVGSAGRSDTQRLSAYHPGGNRAGASLRPNPWRPTATQRAADIADAHSSRVEQVTLTGASTGYRLPALVYLPGSYQADPARRFPMFQMESGFTGSYRTWTASDGIQSILDTLIGAGQLPASVVVMPEQYPILGRDSECVDADPTVLKASLADTYLSHDVPVYMRQHYRIGIGREAMVIGGFSTGGYCAANLALRHSSTYGGAMVLSGYFHTAIDHTTGPLFARHSESVANDPSVTISRPHQSLAWFLSAAEDAPVDVAAVTHFEPRVPLTDGLRVVLTRTGGHSAAAWRVGSRIGFCWMASVLGRQ